MLNKIWTVLAATFLAALPLAFLWYTVTTISACVFRRGPCNDWDAASVGGLLGFGFLGLVIWAGNKWRR